MPIIDELERPLSRPDLDRPIEVHHDQRIFGSLAAKDTLSWPDAVGSRGLISSYSGQCQPILTASKPCQG